MDFTSPMHLILIIIIIALLFGGKKIPELMRGIGSGIKEFKKASSLDGESEKKPGDKPDSTSGQNLPDSAQTTNQPSSGKTTDHPADQGSGTASGPITN